MHNLLCSLSLHCIHVFKLSFLAAPKHPCVRLAVSVGWSVGRVTHTFDDRHGAPTWPKWPCFHVNVALGHASSLMYYNIHCLLYQLTLTSHPLTRCFIYEIQPFTSFSKSVLVKCEHGKCA